jgi:indolepyruvate ferredoxin oxidoreductase beta subunit
MDSLDNWRNRSGCRILIAGTGGQGVLTAARLLCDCFVELGHQVVSGQLHGMAQRGGAVRSCVIIDGGISPVIARGRADFVLGFEPVETARALPFMSSSTVVYMNTAPVMPFVLAQRAVLKQGEAAYPDVTKLSESIQSVVPNTLTFDATQCAVEAGSAKALNMVMLGCLLGSGCLPCSPDDFWNSVSKRMPPALKETNTKAFMKGVELAAELGVGRGTP